MRTAVAGHPLPSLLGALPGVVLLVVGALGDGVAGVVLAGLGLVLTLAGAVTGAAYGAYRDLTRAVPDNLFGICRGLGEGGRPGLTEWLSDRIDEVAGRPEGSRPLTFGDLWRGADGDPALPAPEPPDIDLRMMTTCLSQRKPYQLPWDARTFFYDPEVWATLFPPAVMAALDEAPGSDATGTSSDAESAWEEAVALRHDPPLRRLPDAEHLPVIVATRMSLSFPLLISAVPLHTVERRSPRTKDAVRAYRAARDAGRPLATDGLDFATLWFTDGGLCSNFPLHMFDAALPTRPTFAINLGRLPDGEEPDADQLHNIEYAEDNRAIPPTNHPLARTGLPAVVGFAVAAVDTARTWQDGSLLDFPGYRDRIVRVLQSRSEGGLNLEMDGATIRGLGERGEVGIGALMAQFAEPRYPAADPRFTGWDNHRWVRFRALLSVLPDFLTSYDRGAEGLQPLRPDQPSYRLGSDAQRTFAAELSRRLRRAADEVAEAGRSELDAIEDQPNPQGRLRRVPSL